MVRKILKSLREYKKETILAPLFVTFEVIMECIIPFVMADLIDHMAGESITPVLKYGIALFIMALLSLLFGVLSGKAAATAPAAWQKTYGRICISLSRISLLQMWTDFPHLPW